MSRHAVQTDDIGIERWTAETDRPPGGHHHFLVEDFPGMVITYYLFTHNTTTVRIVGKQQSQNLD